MYRLIRGDCLEALRKLPDESVDLVCTDPPYNVGYRYASYNDAMPDEQYLAWQLAVLRQCERVLTPNGSLFYLNYPEFNCRIYAALLQKFALRPIELIAWTYNAHTGGKPLRKAFRTWIWASKGNPSATFTCEYKDPCDKRVARLIAQGKKPSAYDWWHMEQVKNVSQEKTAHPCQLPVAMVSTIIAATTRPGDIVLDPFLGSGTTALAAKMLRRGYIGIECDKTYIDIARKRLRGASRLTSRHIATEERPAVL
jgi:site-specific DNA-methyltransferase (adenine-specific)